MGGFLDGGLNGDPDSSIFDTGLNGEEDSNILDTGLNGDADSNIIDSVKEADAAAEDWFASGTTRDVWDWMFDYEGEWRGQTDQHDITGPSFNPLNWLDSGSDESAFQYNAPDAQDDPTNPDNWPIPPEYVKWLLVAAVLAYVFGQLFDVQIGGG